MAKKLVGTLSISGMPLGDTGGGSPDAVLFTPQQLTTAQKTQARTNIGAVSAAEVDKAVESIDLTPYATKVYVEKEIAAIDIPSLEGYATEQFVKDEIATIPEVDLTGYAKETWVDEKLVSYALKTELPNLTGYATEDYVNEKVAAVKVEVPTATTETLGIVKPDGITIIVKDGVLTAVGGGGGIWEYPTQFNNDLRLFQGLTIIQSNNDLV